MLGPWAPLIVDCVIHENTAVGLGGGITADDGAQPIIRRCRIYGNSAGDGGGICLTFSGAWIAECEIHGNQATFGGGLDLLSATAVKVSQAHIRSNAASFLGGGVYASSSSAALEECIIQGNTTEINGGAGWLHESNLAFARCTLWDNSAEVTAGGLYLTRSLAYLRDCDVKGNGLAIFVEGIPTQPVDARFNWWGDSSGPYHPLLNPAGQGDELGDHVDFIPWNGTSSVLEAARPPVCRLQAPALFRGSLPILVTLFENARVNLSVFDAQGRHLATLLDREVGAGTLHVDWDGRAAHRTSAGTGVRFLRLAADRDIMTVRVVRLR